MLMSVQKEKNVAESVVSEAHAGDSVYASLFEKINLSPVSALSALDIWQDPQAMSEASADERLTAGMQVFMECLAKAGTQVEKLDKALIDHHIAELDYQISRQLDAVLHHPEFQKVESLWRGVKSLVDKTDFRRNVKIELLDLSKDDLRQDFEDAPEIIQSGLYLQTYVAEYDTPGGEPIAALVSAWEFDASAQDVALLKNISRVAASAHMPFIGSVGPAFFQKETMEEVAAIKDIGNHFERAEYIKWNAFRETDDARYIGLVMPRVLGRLPYGPDNWQKSVRSRALPEEAMAGWNEGMTRLQQLAERLNRLDEQRGKYMTVSELKTEVFGIMQAFNRHIPAEEQLRRYDEVRNQNSSEQQQKKVENGLVELVSRYWVLTQGDMK
ncbi:type VI secretion system contractile sheath large subunit [Escherichia coli]